MLISTLKPQIFYTLATAAIYGILGLVVYSQDAFLGVGRLYQVPIVALAEVLKLAFIRRVYGLHGTSVSTQRSALMGPDFNVLRESLKFAGLHLASILAFCFLCMVLGAPVLWDLDKTLSLASLLTSLTILPFALFLGVRGTLFELFTPDFELMSLNASKFLRFLEASAGGVILGAWAASLVFPLDWDRPWQVYPLPNFLGAVGGHVVGCLLGSVKSFAASDLKL